MCSGFVADRPMVVVAATVGSDVNALFITKRTLQEQSAIKKKRFYRVTSASEEKAIDCLFLVGGS